MFGVRHYNPSGGLMSLKLAKNSGNSAMSIMMDEKIYTDATLKAMDPKTVHIDLFISSGEHTLQIKGIRTAA
jgi:hypothetical protein